MQEQLILEKKKNLEEARGKFIQAMKERKIMDKLKEEQYIRYPTRTGKKRAKFSGRIGSNFKKKVM